MAGISFTRRVQFEFIFDPFKRLARPESLTVGTRRVPLILVRNRRARRYVLRLRPDGSARVTVPRGGSATEARRFAHRHTGWVERELQRLAVLQSSPKEWRLGTEILFRGQSVRLEADAESSRLRLGSEALKVGNLADDLRPVIEKYLWKLAAKELAPRVMGLAAFHKLSVRKVSVRNQRSRWGSCSRKGTISLNWRLIQAPAFVRDYIIVHELMHLREMNHSPRFWREVERAFPDYRTAERWLKEHSALLR